MAGVLSGVRVLDFTAHTSGPVATAAMADCGAEVIKVEPPIKGDDTRSLSPRLDGQAMTYMTNNRGKKSITVNMKDPEGIRILKELIKISDVVVENFRPGIMKRYGLDYESIRDLNPGIVYCSVSAYGQFGPSYTKPGFDVVVQARSGAMDLTGEPDRAPVKIGIVLGDMVAAKDAFGAICAALYHKAVTGEGQYIDISMLECMTSMNLYIDHAMIGLHPARRGKHHISLSPYGIFEGKNGQTIVIAAFTNYHFGILCREVLLRPELVDDPRFVTPEARVDHYLEVADAIESWLKTFDDIDDALHEMEAHGLVCTRILTPEQVANDPQLIAHGGITEIEAMPSMKNVRSFKTRAHWAKYSATPAVCGRPPELGEHNSEVLSMIGMTPAEIEELEKKWNAKK